MSLIEFVKLEHVRDKFKIEFRPVYKQKIKFERKSRAGDTIPKEQVGIYLCDYKGKTKLICDSYGRKKFISCIEDLTGFFTYSKYKNNVCWVYDDSLKFDFFLKYLPKEYLEQLETSGQIKYYSHTIECKDNTSFKVKLANSYNEYKFYNLYPFFHSNLNDAAKKHLYYDESTSLKKMNKNINSWDNADIIVDIVDYCKEKAKLIQTLASYQKEHDSSNILSKEKIINEPKTGNHALVGTAFDYLLRFLIQAYNPTAISSPWIAYKSLEELRGKEKKFATSIISEAERRFSLFLKDKTMSDDLIISTLLLAKLDAIVRRGILLDEIDMENNPGDIEDLRNLIAGVPKDMYLGKEICILNPSFGLASQIVGGADADLLLDNTLIEIKTIINPKFSPEYFHQLMGYVILHYLGLLYSKNIKNISTLGLLYEEGEEFDLDIGFLSTKIERIGVYFSRYDHLYTIDLREIFPNGKMDWKLLEWFEQEAHKEYQPVLIKKYFNLKAWKKCKLGKIPVDEFLYGSSQGHNP